MSEAAAAVFDGRILIVAPHMDDESLGCGLLLASHPEPARVHLAYAADGTRSPEPSDPSLGDPAVLSALRRQEALEAADCYGIPEGNVHFLGFQDGTLAAQCGALERAIVALVARVLPVQVFVPFRYDWHPDHLAAHRAVVAAKAAGKIAADIIEYFVYSQWRLLPGSDVRAYLDPVCVRRISWSSEAAARKRRALACHRTQVTCYFDWQSQPILTPELIDRSCAEAESYLLHNALPTGQSVFRRAASWISFAHHVEPALKRVKDRWLGRVGP